MTLLTYPTVYTTTDGHHSHMTSATGTWRMPTTVLLWDCLFNNWTKQKSITFIYVKTRLYFRDRHALCIHFWGACCSGGSTRVAKVTLATGALALRHFGVAPVRLLGIIQLLGFTLPTVHTGEEGQEKKEQITLSSPISVREEGGGSVSAGSGLYEGVLLWRH